jgi:Mrp family chromosome partitioning ATPase
MSRILEALQRIGVQERDEAAVPPDATTAAARRAEGSRHPAVDSGQSAGGSEESGAEGLQGSEVDSDPRFTELVDQLLKTFPPDRPAVLMLASPGPEDGKTSVTAGLVKALAARLPGEVLAVDGDREYPRSSFDDWRCSYRFAVIDGPCLTHPETTAMARCCDGVLLVIALGRTGRRAARRAVRTLARGGANVLGCVVAGA